MAAHASNLPRTLALASHFRPSVRGHLYDLCLVLAGSALIALAAQVSIPLPLWLSPVPITGQTFAVLLIGALFGPSRAVATILAYLAEGAAGLPVFAGATAGLPALLGPTGGYLFGFIPAAGLMGVFAAKGWDRRIASTFIAMLISSAPIFICGMLWLLAFIPASRVVSAGLFPFIPGDIIKSLLAAGLLPAAWKLLAVCGRFR